MKRNNSRKLRRAICLFSAATMTLQSNHVVNTLTQPETTRRQTKSAVMKKNGISKSLTTALYEHLSRGHENASPAIKVESDLGSEFIGLNVASPLGTTSDFQPLFVSQSLSDEQRKFDLMLGKALDT